MFSHCWIGMQNKVKYLRTPDLFLREARERWQLVKNPPVQNRTGTIIFHKDPRWINSEAVLTLWGKYRVVARCLNIYCYFLSMWDPRFTLNSVTLLSFHIFTINSLFEKNIQNLLPSSENAVITAPQNNPKVDCNALCAKEAELCVL